MSDQGSTVTTTVHRKPFAAFLQEHRAGGLHAELSDAIAEVSAAVLEHEKPGTVLLQIKVVPNKDGRTVMVFDDVKVKAPLPARGAAIYFPDERGNLNRRDPMQPELPLRGLQSDDGALRDLDDDKAASQ